ncbi:MAG: hypothetical protein U5L06_10655 [Rhodovibrio sp.]|nr:hypothetical protein [Rhodovibrio sp.]
MGDVDAAIEAARRIVNFVADAENAPAPRASEATIAVAREPSAHAAAHRERPARRTPVGVAGEAAPSRAEPATNLDPTSVSDDRAEDPQATERPVPDVRADATPRPSNGGTGVGRGAGPKARWDDEAEQVLRAEWGTGRPVEEIAALIGRTVGSTRERARRLGLSRPKRSEIAPEYRPQPAGRPAPGGRAQSADVRTFKAGAKRKRRRRPRHEDMRRAEPIDISAYRIQRPGETIESVVNFVRSRDYQVVRAEDGTFVVDGRKQFSEAAFVEWANGLRRMLNKPAFALECAQAT